jgi:hypothetical protein
VKKPENGKLVQFLRGQIISLHLGGASVTESDTLLGVSRVTVSKFSLAYMKHGRQYQQRGTMGKKTDCHTMRRIVSTTTTKSQNCNTNDSRTEYS